MNIGLFFGSFNPVHVGHMIIANYIATHTELDKVWMVVSPHNPLKQKATLAKDHDRLHLVHLAIGENTLIQPSDVEFYLPKPSYTIDTLTHLKEKHPDKTFSLIMGGDNIATINKWKNFEKILEHKIYVYKRPNVAVGEYGNHPNVIIVEAPLLDLSATYIRDCLAQKKSIQYLVPDKVFEYIQHSNMYR
jgi:nicotinate-nucleotide adenylyltransferase